MRVDFKLRHDSGLVDIDRFPGDLEVIGTLLDVHSAGQVVKHFELSLGEHFEAGPLSPDAQFEPFAFSRSDQMRDQAGAAGDFSLECLSDPFQERRERATAGIVAADVRLEYGLDPREGDLPVHEHDLTAELATQLGGQFECVPVFFWVDVQEHDIGLDFHAHLDDGAMKIGGFHGDAGPGRFEGDAECGAPKFLAIDDKAP